MTKHMNKHIRIAGAEDPRSKIQDPEKLQAPSAKASRSRFRQSLVTRLHARSLDLGSWIFSGAWILVLGAFSVLAADATAEIKSLSLNGGVEDGTARLVIEARLKPIGDDQAKVIFASAVQHSMKVSFEKITHAIRVQVEVLQGEPKEIPLALSGEGEVKQVTGDGLLDWSVRQQDAKRFLVLRPKKADRAVTNLSVMVAAETELGELPKSITPLALASSQPALGHGFVRVDAEAALSVKSANPSGVIAVEDKYLPEVLRGVGVTNDEPLAFRFQGGGYSLPLQITVADPEARRVTLANFKLSGQLAEDSAAFTLTATARVKNPKGGEIELLSGNVALTGFGDTAANASPSPLNGERAGVRGENADGALKKPSGAVGGTTPHPQSLSPLRGEGGPRFGVSGGRIKFENGRFIAVFDEPGEYPIRLRFNATVRHADGWNSLDFRVASSALQPVTLAGLPADTQFRFSGGAKPERAGVNFVSFLPADGAAQLSWKAARAEAEGKLFYSAEMLAQISVAPGLMRQSALLEGKVMQGELTRVTLRLIGAGEVTRVQVDQLRSWDVEPIANSTDRRLVVQFNQPQKDAFTLLVQMQSPLAAFPQTFDAMRLQPEGATRFAGYARIVNEGAVRLEVAGATGLTQVSPEQFPESDVTRSVLRTDARQRFVYRFSGADHALRIAADNVLPEISVSQLIAYNLGETELAIDAEFEIDIREAPLRELLISVPKGYALARLTAASMSDSVLAKEQDNQPNVDLRLVFGQPVSGRQVVALRLERNKALGDTNWVLPRLEVAKAKSTRGHVAVSADAGFRVTPATTQGLTEIATAFFPRKLANIQSALRLSDAAWQATMRVERLPQSIQVDAFHLFSIAERIAYGSSVMNYQISGAPLATFHIELSGEYFNVEFLGKDVRNWTRTTNGFEIHLHTPVSGAYTLLASYERPFKGAGETLAFTGARPLDAQSEQGHTIVVSAYQFDVKPANVSAGLLALEAAEVPAEYRLFFDAPILAAYRYASRPFNLQLVLSPLAQGDTLNQVADRASITTRISKEGQVVTAAKYFVKNRGQPNFKLTLQEGSELWSATVNGVTAVPTKDGKDHLIPMPQRADPNAVTMVELKLASKSPKPGHVRVAAPVVGAPVLLADWKLEADAGQRLEYDGGTLAPAQGVFDNSGFAGLVQLLRDWRALALLAVAFALLTIGLVVWRWAGREGVFKFSAQQMLGLIVGTAALVFSAMSLVAATNVTERAAYSAPKGISFVAPIQKAAHEMIVEVRNVEDKFTAGRVAGHAWPALLALVVWLYGFSRGGSSRRVAGATAWTLLFWAALRWPNGVLLFLGLLGLFVLLHLILPAVRRLWQLPPKPQGTPPPENIAPVVTALVMGCLVLLSTEASAVVTPFIISTATERHSLSPQRGEGRGEGWELGEASAMWTSLDRTTPHPHSLSPLRGEGGRLVESLALRGEFLNTARSASGATLDAPVLFAAADSSAIRIPSRSRRELEPAMAESVTQQLRVEDKFAFATAKIRWNATKGQSLPILLEPAVLTRITYPTNALKLIQSGQLRKRYELAAVESGTFEIELEYQLQPKARDGGSGFELPTHGALVNELTLTLVNLDVDINAPNAVSVEPQAAGATSNTVAKLVLPPASEPWIGWRPRSRDTKREKAVFFAELFQLYVPAAGAIEGQHQALIRPSQGELSELIFNVPAGATISDVLDPLASTNRVSLVSLWRFDPDARQLRVTLRPAQSKPFSVLIKSQFAVGPLPMQQSVGLLSVANAAGQIGSLGVATGPDVQLDNVTSATLTPINLEDYPSSLVQRMSAQFPGLTLRRAFRYAEPGALATVTASAVEPDVRVEPQSQQTLSLGEDRTVLAANLTVEISRAGIFRLSFVLPTGLDVESISGAALSHWTEAKTDAQRIITLHLNAKTLGSQQFSISLAGPGVKAVTNWAVPKLSLREATKQAGALVIVPEQGTRAQVATRDGLTQLDPQKSGIRQKGVLAFRLLQSDWSLALDLEQVDPWVQVNSLQHVVVGEAQLKATANLQYQIENTGLKALRVWLPVDAGKSVQIRGDQVADFLPREGAVTNAMQEWEVKLHRRIIGSYFLQVTYQVLTAEQAREVTVRGVEAGGVNLQRGFLTVESSGRLQIETATLPALQPSEWQTVPRALRQDLQAAAANFTFRLVEPAFVLPVKVQRHEAAKLLAARVNKTTLKSVVSDDGMMLTQVRLDLVPGDKRLLEVTLPKDAKFWFAFVNQNGVAPWIRQNRILVPLEQQSKPDAAIAVELFYSSAVGGARGRALDMNLLGPKFDLPLEDITWQVYLNEKWQVKDWKGTLQLLEARAAGGSVMDLGSYLQRESALRSEKTKVAEQQLQLGNSLLSQGAPQQARMAFNNAYNFSQHDQAFNEDARVQLHNVKIQQALVGLNVRQLATGGEAAGALAGKVRELRNRRDNGYSQDEAKQLFDNNPAAENAALMRLAEKMIQQQDAAVVAPAAIHAAIPEQGRVLTFKRAVEVNPWAEMKIKLETKAARGAAWGMKVLLLVVLFGVAGVVMSRRKAGAS